MLFVNKYDIIKPMKNKKFLAFFLASLTIIYSILLLCSSCKSADEEKKGVLQNTIVFITFEKDGNNFEEGFFDKIYKTFETSHVGVKNYLKEQSNGKVILQTYLCGGIEGQTVRSNFGVNYYKPRYEWINDAYELINEEGYDNRYFSSNGEAVKPKSANSKQHIDGIYREQLLLREIFSKISLPKNYKSDYSDDGKADLITLITDQDATSEWGDILWPHSGICHSADRSYESIYYFDDENEYPALKTVEVGDGKLYSYNFFSSYEICKAKLGESADFLSESDKELYNVGLLAHETLHAVGLSDYYSYESLEYESVGEFDIMGTTHALPQNVLGYLRLKLGWLSYDDILYINESGKYTLPLSSSDEGRKIAKIVLPDYKKTGEYFMAEFRGKSFATAQSPYDASLSSDGLIIYRINPVAAYINAEHKVGSTDFGNMFGTDEVYVYRFGDPEKLKKLVGPLGSSYAMLGNGEKIVTPADLLAIYSDKEYGNVDISKSFENNLKRGETLIHYSNGENSGIRFDEITVDEENQTVSFNVTLPSVQTEGENSEKIISLEKLPNGKNRLFFESEVNKAKVQILVVKSTNRLINATKDGSFDLDSLNFKKKKLSLYKTLLYDEIPYLEREYVLPEINDDFLVFARITDENGSSVTVFAGRIRKENLTFGEYFSMVCDPVYCIIVGFIIVAVPFFAIFTVKFIKKENEKKVVRK